jgi:microcystin-dependent protein
MATLNIPNTFSNGTAANATEVNANFSAVKTFVETALVQADGSVKAGTSAINDGAITQAKLDSGVLNLLSPVGSILQYGGSSAPSGWLLCTGTELSITTYQSLYNVLTVNGTVFPYGANTNGSGSAGSTHFRLPNLQGRVPVGRDASQTEFDVLGETGGAKTHTLTSAEMPNHGHTVNQSDAGAHSHTVDGGAHAHTIPTRTYTGSAAHSHDGSRIAKSSSPSTANDDTSTVNGAYGDGSHAHSVSSVENHNHGVSVNNTGDGGAHNNLQPYIVLNYIIKF